MNGSKPESKSGIKDEPPLDLEERVIDALRTVCDPEIPVNIYELGLVYSIDAKSENVTILMTLTCPGCPVAGSLPMEVRSRVTEIDGVKSVKVELVWDPPWNPDMISEAGKLQLGIF
jgi:FeS assembly SUF system protein